MRPTSSRRCPWPPRVAGGWRSGLLHLRGGGPDRPLLSRGPAQSDIATRVGRGATGRIEGGGAGIAVASRHRLVQLELEGGPPVCAAPLRVGAEPEWLSELPAPLGICAETVQETLAQGRTQCGDMPLRRSIALKAATRRTGAKIFFADEARFPADGGLRARWVLKGEPAPGGLHQHRHRKA